MSSQEEISNRHLDSILDDAVEELDLELCEPVESIDTSYLDKIKVIQETVTEFPYDLSDKNSDDKDNSPRVFELSHEDVEDVEDVEDDITTTEKEVSIPEKFPKLMFDFINDVNTTFPEYKPLISKWWGFDSYTNEQVFVLFKHCYKVYPPRFTDIIYKNEDIFKDDSDLNVDFLPGISFKYLWNCNDISEQTRDILWKYLQMIVLSVVSTSKNDNMGEDMKKVLDSIDEETFKSQLEDTIGNIQEAFEGNSENASEGSSQNPMESMQQQMNSLMGGKLGSIATEIAEEATRSIDLDQFNGSESVNDVFKKVFENPGNLMNLVKDVSSKLESKISSGDVDHNELLQEATGLMENMKDMPGMDQIQSLLSNANRGSSGSSGSQPDISEMMSSMMGSMGNTRRGERVDTNKMNQQVRKTNQIKQMRERIEKKKQQQAEALHNALQASNEIAEKQMSEQEIEQWLQEEEEKEKVNEKQIEESKKSQGKKKKSKNKK